MKKKGHAANLSLEDISADHLSMETLLSLTSKRAGEWFKEELRELGGLDHLVKQQFGQGILKGQVSLYR
jgi:Wings apart-like protein regulation of heterochromatin